MTSRTFHDKLVCFAWKFHVIKCLLGLIKLNMCVISSTTGFEVIYLSAQMKNYFKREVCEEFLIKEISENYPSRIFEKQS